MPISYHCDVCGQSGVPGPGWIIASASVTKFDEHSVRQGVETRDFYFHNQACYDQWIAPKP